MPAAADAAADVAKVARREPASSTRPVSISLRLERADARGWLAGRRWVGAWVVGWVLAGGRTRGRVGGAPLLPPPASKRDGPAAQSTADPWGHSPDGLCVRARRCRLELPLQHCLGSAQQHRHVLHQRAELSALSTALRVRRIARLGPSRVLRFWISVRVPCAVLCTLLGPFRRAAQRRDAARASGGLGQGQVGAGARQRGRGAPAVTRGMDHVCGAGGGAALSHQGMA